MAGGNGKSNGKGGNAGKTGSARSLPKKPARRPGEWETVFLNAYAELGEVKSAAAVAGITDRAVHKLKKNNQEFADLCEVARAKAGAWWVKNAIRIAADTDSAAVTIFMLKKLLPDVFGDTRVNINIAGEGSSEEIAKKIQAAAQAMRTTVPQVHDDGTDA